MFWTVRPNGRYALPAMVYNGLAGTAYNLWDRYTQHVCLYIGRPVHHTLSTTIYKNSLHTPGTKSITQLISLPRLQ